MPRRVPGFFSDRFRFFLILEDQGVADLPKHLSPRNLSLKNEFANRERYLVSPPTRRLFSGSAAPLPRDGRIPLPPRLFCTRFLYGTGRSEITIFHSRALTGPGTLAGGDSVVAYVWPRTMPIAYNPAVSRYTRLSECALTGHRAQGYRKMPPTGPRVRRRGRQRIVWC
jgi:hypothetical protein